jgi:hypothetical protein
MTLDGIIDVLATEQRLELRNFGVFEVRKRKARKARNPRTGEQVMVPETQVVTFKAGKRMDDIIGGLEVGPAEPEEGDVPSPLHPPPGCTFHPRCPLAEALCRRQRPELTEVGPHHLAACHRIGAARDLAAELARP